MGKSKFHDQRLIEAVKANKPIEAKSALASKADPDLMDITGEPILHYCARYQYLEIMRHLIAFGANVNITDKHGVSTIRKICKEGWLEPARIVLSTQNLKLNEIDDVGDTLLHNCAARGRKGSTYLPISGLLIEKGVLISAKNERAETPLHHAARYGGPRMCQLLLHANADINAKDLDGYTPIHAAALGVDNDESLKFLLQSKGNPNERERNGQTPLHLLASVSKTRTFDQQRVRTLLQFGANPWFKDLDGLTAFEKAQRGRSQKREIDTLIINLLRPKGPMPLDVALDAPFLEREKRK